MPRRRWQKGRAVAPFLRLQRDIPMSPNDSEPMTTTAQASATNLMDPTEPLLNRSELEALHAHYREIKHSINNTFAVIMALSELGQRNPAHLEKLAKAVLQRSPEVVNQLTAFGEKLGAKLKEAK